ncbi:cyanoexosortase A [Anthocerotibacter panamensis]|uniref:cyanoexosortase A n=1 Tax=Anthocerotibacter panamensis TaxID=2857077 RepID=UPI001C4077B0|nr:cyanoexosortase A [Anthocerotibacter panamensis]
MNRAALPLTAYFQDSKYWLFSTAITLMCLHLTLLWKVSSNFDYLSISLLFEGTALYLLYQKRDQIQVEGGPLAYLIGLTLIGLVLMRALFNPWFGPFLQITPFLGGLGLALIAGKPRQYWRELVIFALVGGQIPFSGFILKVVNIPVHAAQFSTFLLWYLGYPVTRQGANVALPTGSILVNPGCAGIDIIYVLLGLTVLFVLLVPLDWRYRLILPGIAYLLAFTVNGVRVALLAVLQASGDKLAFEYWHMGDGASLFSIVSLVGFGWVLRYFARLEPPSLLKTP